MPHIYGLQVAVRFHNKIQVAVRFHQKHCFTSPCSDIFNVQFTREALVGAVAQPHSPPPPPPNENAVWLGKNKQNKTKQCRFDSSGMHNFDIADLEELLGTAFHICLTDRWGIQLAIRKKIASKG